MLRVIEGTDPLNVLSHGKPASQHVREFGSLFGLIAVSISAVILYRGGSGVNALLGIAIAAGFVFSGMFAPKRLYPVWKAWMAFAEKLSIVMTFVILMVAWCLLVVPMALLLRAFRVKVMDMDFRRPVSTYWEERPAKVHDFKLLERQF